MSNLYLHVLPGRIRVQVPSLKGNALLAAEVTKDLGARAGITSVAANVRTGRVLVSFDQRVLNHYIVIEHLDTIKESQRAEAVDWRVPQVVQLVPTENEKVSIKEPEDWPLKWQITQVLLSGSVLLMLFLKHRLFGRSAWAYSPALNKLATLTTIATGYPIIFSGLQHLAKKKRINYDLIIAGTTLSLLVLRESYIGLLVMWLVQLSGLFQTINLVRARKRIEHIAGMEPASVWLEVEESVVAVPVQELKPGDIVVIKTGELVQIDGEIIGGQAAIDQSRVTGMPHPLFVEVGDKVFAGNHVLDGYLRIRVENAYFQTSLRQNLDLVTKHWTVNDVFPEMNGRSDRVVTVSLILSSLTFLLTGNAGRSLAMMLAACPSAVGLAAPVAVGLAVGNAANHGMYVRDGKYLLAAGQVDTVIFDKTGTLTVKEATIEEVIVVSRTYTQEEIIGYAALAEGVIDHPIAHAVRKKALELHTRPVLAADHLEMVTGLGVRAKVGEHHILVGNEGLMSCAGIKLEKVKAKLTRFYHQGLTPILVAVDGKVCGVLGARESLNPESRLTVQKLRASGINNIILLSGDTPEATSIMAAQLGIEQYQGNMQPYQKADYVRYLESAGHQVMVVGDGVNDVPAMKAAITSVAMGCTGMQSAACAGGIIVPSASPSKVVDLVLLGQETRETVKQNYTTAIGLNMIGLGLGVTGLINPLSAGLLTNIGTLAVLYNSWRLSRSKRDNHKRNPKLEQPIAITTNMEPIRSNWHVLSKEQVVNLLSTCQETGLTRTERELRIERYGNNLLAVEKKASWLELLLEPFKDFMVQLLLGASALSVLVGEYADAITIVSIISVEAVLGLIQGLKAEKSLDSLKQLSAPEAKVLVDGGVLYCKADILVPGDIIILEEGDSVPADCRLLKSVNLEIEESALTGESLPVLKSDDQSISLDTNLADRLNMVYMGTCVTKGRAMAVVVATGMQTEMGRLAKMLSEVEEETTPLQHQLEHLGKQLTVGCLVVCGGVMVAGLLRGRPVLEMLRMGVSLAVGAIPEGLPAVVSIAMAFGMQRMVKRNAIVRRLPAVETLGSASVICTDKTGTLTKNEMTVTEIYADGQLWKITGEGYTVAGEFLLDEHQVVALEDKNLCRVLTAAALCNNANANYSERTEPVFNGDPTEIAMLVAAIKGGLPWPELKDNYCRHKEITFDSNRKMMTVVCHDQSGTKAAYTKGAPDIVLNKCSKVYKDNKLVSLSLKERNNILAANENMASKALRVLAVAYKSVEESLDDDELEEDLVFLGLIGMADPPRAGVAEAIAKCRNAGIKVVMVTGDHPLTASAIAQQIGLLQGGRIVTGSELEKMSDEELYSIIDQVEVCSRTTPEHKLRIVKAFKRRGHVVAMTGDGVNDAPAIKEADIGIAMGKKGTDVTREAADITLTDDNFATIVSAVEEGRTVGDNIRKSIKYVLPGNLGEVLAIFVAAVAGLPMPLVPSQILWVNLVTESIPAMALGADPPEAGVMNRPPRSVDEPILGGGLGNRVLTHGVITGITTFGLFTGTIMIGGSLGKARTMAFTNLVASQLFNLFECRKNNHVDAHSAPNKLLVPSAGISAGLVLAAIYLPFLRPIFQTVPLGLADWGAILAAAGVTGKIEELFLGSTKPNLIQGRELTETTGLLPTGQGHMLLHQVVS